jgi:hypothetical protein
LQIIRGALNTARESEALILKIVHSTKTAPNTKVRELKYKPKYRFQNEDFYLCTNGFLISCKPKGKLVNVFRNITTKLPYKERKR